MTERRGRSTQAHSVHFAFYLVHGISLRDQDKIYNQQALLYGLMATKVNPKSRVNRLERRPTPLVIDPSSFHLPIPVRYFVRYSLPPVGYMPVISAFTHMDRVLSKPHFV